MNKLKSGLVAVVIVLLIIPVKAQFRLSGEFRPRTEFSHGYKSLATENQDWSVATAQRTRLNAIFSANGINTKLVLQDVRYWGSQPQLVANEDYATSVHEGWAEIFLTENFSLKAGRQELVYDDSRIFRNVGRAHQARSLMFAGESMELLKGGDHSLVQHWEYIMLSVTPSFLQ